MKKFLSLVLALVMTMSLVTISAGATEYKDLTDKNEIKYDEAVAVLNKIGIITGYEDGSFKPTNNLTRGAAAKIIVSLMIGSEAASALNVTVAPYKDVPVTNTFAAVISYCKTAGYISGYGDNTFRPSDPLTGYAFSKMLLGALGYKSNVEGFTGSGWTMKVASLGTKIGMFDSITDFSGVTAVTREVAAQLALNTLKGTMVEYKGMQVDITGDTNVSINDSQINNVVNTAATDGNIGAADGVMQFAEARFTSLKLNPLATSDDFGRPANEWVYKNVSVGDFPVKPDFVFTAKVGKTSDTNETALKNLGMKGYTEKSAGAEIYTNGTSNVTPLADATLGQQIQAATGNGTTVEVYVVDGTANKVEAVVAVQPQLMQISSVSSKTVSLKQVESMGVGVSAVKEDDSAFAAVSGLKVDDYVVVVPCKTSGSWKVASAYVPTMVTGSMTGVTKDSGVTKTVTVAGTKYNVAALEYGLGTLDADKVSNTKKDVTIYVDSLGYATYIKDVGSSSEFMIYKDTFKTLVDGKMTTFVRGYDFSGNLVELNIGTIKEEPTADGAYNTTAVPGDIVNYTTTGATAGAEYVVATKQATGIAAGARKIDAAVEIKASDITVKEDSVPTPYTIASDVKTVFVTFDTDNTVKSVTVKNGLANVSADELAYENPVTGADMTAEMYLNKDGAVKAIVVKGESKDAVSDTVLYIDERVGEDVISGTKTYTYKAYVNGAEESIVSTDKLNAGEFASFTVKADGTYTMRKVSASDSATSAVYFTMTKDDILSANNNLIGITDALNAPKDAAGGAISGAASLDNKTLNTDGAVWVDLTDNGITSGKSLKNASELDGKVLDVKVVMNNKASADKQYKVAMIVIDEVGTLSNRATVTYGTPSADVKNTVAGTVTVQANAPDGATFTAGAQVVTGTGAAKVTSASIDANGLITINYNNTIATGETFIVTATGKAADGVTVLTGAITITAIA